MGSLGIITDISALEGMSTGAKAFSMFMTIATCIGVTCLIALLLITIVLCVRAAVRSKGDMRKFKGRLNVRKVKKARRFKKVWAEERKQSVAAAETMENVKSEELIPSDSADAPSDELAAAQEEEIAAVIMAAISAYQADSGNNRPLVVRRIRRTGGNRWGRESISENTRGNSLVR